MKIIQRCINIVCLKHTHTHTHKRNKEPVRRIRLRRDTIQNLFSYQKVNIETV